MLSGADEAALLSELHFTADLEWLKVMYHARCNRYHLSISSPLALPGRPLSLSIPLSPTHSLHRSVLPCGARPLARGDTPEAHGLEGGDQAARLALSLACALSPVLCSVCVRIKRVR